MLFRSPKDFWFPADYPISCILLYASIKVPAYIAKILVSCGLSNLLHFTAYKYQGSRMYRKDFGFLRIVQSLAFLLYTKLIYPKDFAFLRIIQSLALYNIQVSRFAHISQRFWFPTDCPISCTLQYASIKVPAYSWVALFSYEKRRQYLP